MDGTLEEKGVRVNGANIRMESGGPVGSKKI
jgi:hypothetical protein